MKYTLFILIPSVVCVKILRFLSMLHFLLALNFFKRQTNQQEPPVY